MNVIAQAVQQANADYPGGCPSCKGIRYKPCLSCGRKRNIPGDFRDGQRQGQVYETTREWRWVNGESSQVKLEGSMFP